MLRGLGGGLFFFFKKKNLLYLLESLSSGKDRSATPETAFPSKKNRASLGAAQQRALTRGGLCRKAFFSLSTSKLCKLDFAGSSCCRRYLRARASPSAQMVAYCHDVEAPEVFPHDRDGYNAEQNQLGYRLPATKLASGFGQGLGALLLASEPSAHEPRHGQQKLLREQARSFASVGVERVLMLLAAVFKRLFATLESQGFRRCVRCTAACFSET